MVDNEEEMEFRDESGEDPRFSPEDIQGGYEQEPLPGTVGAGWARPVETPVTGQAAEVPAPAPAPQPAPTGPAQPGPAMSATDWFERLSVIHQQMLQSLYGRESYRQELEDFGQAITRLQQELEKIRESNNILTQYQSLLDKVQSQVADHEKMLLTQMTQHDQELTTKMQAHAKSIDEQLQRMGNPLAKLDALLEEQSAGFKVFSSLAHRAGWVIGGSVFIGTVIGNLFAALFGV